MIGMEIRINTPNMIPLVVLKAGDCFEYNGDYYIVTSQTDKVNKEIECVNLESGEVEDFTFSAEVFKIEALVTLRRIGEEV